MINETVIQALMDLATKENIRVAEPLSKHTTFRIGGNADLFVEIENENQLSGILEYLKRENLPFLVMGNGSNLLVSDFGFRGIVLQISKKMSQIHVEGNLVVAKAGALMSQVAAAAYQNQLTGLEFASGIPGTIGGGVVMNAGAYDGELKMVIEYVKVVDSFGKISTLSNEEMKFGYRDSIIKHSDLIVLEVGLRLQKGKQEEIKAKMDDFAFRRKDKQPLEYPSAGSTFKRPEGHFAGALIMNAGLRGYRVGDAMVSEKHCGFVINVGNATCEDVKAVISHVQKRVAEEFQVSLETEVIFIGE